MRWLIGVLLVLNLVFGLWQLYFNQPEPEAGPLPDVGQLRLLSERQVGRDANAQTQSVASTVSVATAETASKPPPAPQPVAPPVPVETAPAPPRHAPQSLASTSPPQPQPQPRGPSEACWQLAAADTRAIAENAAHHLPFWARSLGIVTVKASRASAYYVMIPPAKNRDQAEATVQRLRAKGIKDTWRFPRGRYRNAISLGLFSQKSNADSYLQSIRAKGFQAVVQPKEETVERYAVQLRGPASRHTQGLLELMPGKPKSIPCP